MDLLAQLAAAIGFTPAEGEELTVDAVLAAVLEYLDAEPEAIAAAVGDEPPSLRDLHGLLVSLHTAQRGEPVTAERLADIEAIGQAAQVIAGRVDVAERAAVIADLDARSGEPL